MRKVRSALASFLAVLFTVGFLSAANAEECKSDAEIDQEFNEVFGTNWGD